MREENWYKWLVVSLILHFLIVGAFSIPTGKRGKRVDFSTYSVNLVADLGGGGEGSAPAAAKPAPEPAKVEKAPPAKIPKVETKKSKPMIQPKEKEKERTLTPKKKDIPQPKPTTRDEIKSLDEKIREMKKRTQYLDVAGKREGGTGTGKGQGALGLPTSSGGGSRPLDPALQKYMLEVWEKIQDAWHVPGTAFKKNLETVVSIKIRKDGRIVDMDIEQRSGNRVYDEAVLRILRSIDLLPPIPPSLNTDYLEVGFNFHPPGDGR